MRRALIIIFIALVSWQCFVYSAKLPTYILPGPLLIAITAMHNSKLLLQETWPTVVETVLGFLLGSLLGVIGALLMTWLKPVRYWLLPMLVLSQAVPIFAIAPLLVIWLGYGLSAKIAVTALMLIFPVMSAFYDGLQRTSLPLLEMAQLANASHWRILWHLRVPVALPALGTGLKLAATLAPMGAVIGEWVGSSRGLGFLMLNANARLQIALMFAAFLVLAAFSLTLYYCVDKLWPFNKLYD